MTNLIVARLAQLMSKHGYSVETLALDLGLEVSVIQRVIDGDVIDYSLLHDLCFHFQIPPTRLFRDTADLDDLPDAQRGVMETLNNMWGAETDRSVNLSDSRKLFKRVMEGAGKKRSNRGVQRPVIDSILDEILR